MTKQPYQGRIGEHEIIACREWATINAGDDNPMDVYEHRLLWTLAQSHRSSAEYHERHQVACEEAMAEIEKRFVVEPEPGQF